MLKKYRKRNCFALVNCQAKNSMLRMTFCSIAPAPSSSLLLKYIPLSYIHIFLSFFCCIQPTLPNYLLAFYSNIQHISNFSSSFFCILTTYQITRLTTSLEILTENFVSEAQLQTSKLPSLSSHYKFSCQTSQNKLIIKRPN